MIKEESALHRNILVIAHRGYSSKYPESTELAYIRSVELGVDFIEADIQLSKDGHFVVFHDNDLSGVTDGKGRICDYNIHELKQLNVLDKFDNKYGFQPIATLAEVIEISKQSKVKICLELKDISIRHIKNYEELIITFLTEYSSTQKVIFNLPDTPESDDFAKACRIKYPSIPIAYDFSIGEEKTNEIEAFIKRCLIHGIRIVEYEYSFMSKYIIRELKSNGIGVWVWTINNEDDMINAIEMGADGILTDDPYKLCRLIGKI